MTAEWSSKSSFTVVSMKKWQWKTEELQIIFIVELEVLGCSFTLPKGKTYNMLRGATYEEGRIQQLELDENDCAMKITNSIKKFDDGNWRSNITYKTPK